MIYPWQQTQWQQLIQSIESKRLPHAILLTGMTGMGKAEFADAITRALLCSTALTDQKCLCHACRLIANRMHPNILWLTPEKEGQAIKVDAIRDANEFIAHTSLQGEYRVLIIHPANKMNVNAANALLKTLEEPAKGSLILLISDQATQLPATILSRCQRLHFSRPSQDLALDWLAQQKFDAGIDLPLLLKLAQGAPLAAMQLAGSDLLSQRLTLFQNLIQLNQNQSDPVSACSALTNLDSIILLDLTLTWVMDILRLQLNCSDTQLINHDFMAPLTKLAQCISMQKAVRLLHYLQQLRGHIVNGINLNKQLLMEGLFIRWVENANVSR